MADLNRGSTVGGKKIIHQGIADQHSHHIDDIVDIGSAAYTDTGAGGGLYADIITGYHYSDLEQDFVNTNGDEMDSIILNDDPVENSDAVNLNYLSQLSSDFYPNSFMNLTIIGDLNEPLSSTIHNNYEFTLDRINAMINGVNYVIKEQDYDIINIEPRFKNKVIYIYISYDEDDDQWYYSFDTEEHYNTSTLLQIGQITTDSNGVQTIEFIQDDERVGFEHYLITHEKRPHSIVVSNTDGKIDSQYYPSNHSGITTIEGPRYIQANETYMFEITNFNNFSGYYTNVSEGYSYLDGDIIQVETPNSLTQDITLSITRDSYTVEYNLAPFSSLSAFVYAVDDSQQLHQISTDGFLLWTYSGHSDLINGVDSDIDKNAYTASGSQLTVDNSVRKISLENSQQWSNTDFNLGVTSVKVDTNGSVYASSMDETVKKIDDSGNTVWTFSGHNEEVVDIVLDEDGDIYSYDSSTVYKIDPSSTQQLSNTYSGITAYYVDNAENHYVGYSNGDIEKYNSLYELLWTYTNQGSQINHIITDDEGNVYSGGNSRVIDKLDKEGNLIWTFNGHINYINSIAIDNEQNLYTASDDNSIRKIDVDGVQQWSIERSSNINDVDVYLEGVRLQGDHYLQSSNSYQYIIRNYNSSKTYNATVDKGSVSVNNDTITIDTPSDNTSESSLVLNVDDGDYTRRYEILYVYDDILLNGPDPVQSGNTYQYTITNYEPHKTYNISSNLGTVNVSGDTVTLETPSSNTSEQDLTISIDDGLINSTHTITYIYDDILLSGPNNLEAGSSYNYTIDNYVSGRNYTVSSSLGNASVSGDTVTLDLSNVSSDGTANVTISDENVSTDYSYTVESSGYNIYSGSTDNTVRKIDIDGNQIWSFTGHSSDVNGVVVDNNGDVYSASSDGTVKKLDSNGNQTWSFTGHSGGVYAVAVDNNGNVYSGGDDSTIRKINSNGGQVWSFTNHNNDILGVAVDNNGNVYSASVDNTVRKINSNGGQVWSFTNHSSSVYFVAVDQNGNVYSASQDTTVRKIDSSGSEVWTFVGSLSNASGVAVDDVEYVYCSYSDSQFRKVDPNGNQVWNSTIHSAWVYAITVDPDGSVYTGSYDNTVKKSSGFSGDEIWSFNGHTAQVQCVAVDPGTVGAGFWN